MTSRVWLLAILIALSPSIARSQDQSLPPTGTGESANNSCTTGTAHTTCDDDPETPGGDWCTASLCANNPTNPTSWRFTFDTPSSSPSFSASAQSFDAYLRTCATGGNAPDCQLDLYCNATLVTAGTPATISSDTGQKLTQTHTLTGACASDGSDVEIRVVCTATGGPAASRRTADLDAVEWDVTFAGASEEMMIIGESLRGHLDR